MRDGETIRVASVTAVTAVTAVGRGVVDGLVKGAP